MPTETESVREIHAIALTVAALVAVLGWASRGNLNVDGVAYLDLAARLLAGDWRHVVQGYWSPAYPALLATVLGPTGAVGARAAALAHAVNVAIGLGAVALLWRLSLARRNRWFTRFAFLAFLVVSSRTPRLDAVTPDLLLLTVMIGLAGELLRKREWRPVRAGLWGGAAFLVKTSVWPWLVIAFVIVLIDRRRDAAFRRGLVQAGGVAMAVMACWVLPMSLEVGHPTLGDTGSYGACWYLALCDGRSPDTHRGDHTAYEAVSFGAGAGARVVDLANSPWTYAPWSDPSAWQRGIVTQRSVPFDAPTLVIYWLKLLGLTFGLWSGLTLLLVALPLVLGMHTEIPVRALPRRTHGVLILLGLLGMMQFVAVHAEPRLIAPFLMLVALGIIEWRSCGTPRTWLAPVSWAAFALALTLGTVHVADQLRVTASTEVRLARLRGTGQAGGPRQPVAVIGPAFPLVPDLYRANRQVIAQLSEPSVPTILAWPPSVQLAVLEAMRSRGATAVWISKSRDGYSVVPVPPISPP